jgi:hypothetical protein
MCKPMWWTNDCKNKVTSNINSSEQNADSDLPKIYLRIPYLAKQGENLISNVIHKIRRSLKIPIKPIVIYQTKKTSFFCPKKDKIPELCQANVVYEFKCPGSGQTYIGKTERKLQTRLTQHTTNYNNSSAISQHLLIKLSRRTLHLSPFLISWHWFWGRLHWLTLQSL